jgi:hypothetical protein
MIKFAALVEAIHKSIHDAAKSVEADGIRHIHRFFDPVAEDEQTDTGLLKAEQSAAEREFADFDLDSTYRPKTVAMEFPSRTAEGIETVVVDVPLIALSPISTPRVTQAKFTADLQINADKDGNIEIDFPKSSHSFIGKKRQSRGNTQIEITIEASESPDGLQKIIEGYERVLRAQIPG